MDLLLLLLLLLLQFLDGSFSQKQPVFGLHVQKKVTVQKGLCVSIPCSFYYPPESRNNDTAHGYWYWKKSQDEPRATKEDPVATNDPQKATQPWAQGRFYLIGDPQMDNCSLSITGAQKRDRGHYEFRVEKGNLRYSYTNDRVLIQVETLTQKPEIHMPEILEPGHQVALTCLVPGDCRNGTSASFLWTGNALSSQQVTSSNRSSSRLLFTPQHQDNGTNLTCQVKFPEGRVNTKRTVQLRIAAPCRWNVSSDNGTSSLSLFWKTVIEGALIAFIVAAVVFISLWVCLVKILSIKESKGHVKTSRSGISTNQVSNGIPLDQHENLSQHHNSETPPQIVLTNFPQEEDNQVQYASISFQNQKPQEIHKLEDVNSEYSELKFHNEA